MESFKDLLHFFIVNVRIVNIEFISTRHMVVTPEFIVTFYIEQKPGIDI